jgi:ankyrin repeat protein
MFLSKKIQTRITRTLIFSFISLGIYAQETPVTDTGYFVPWDDNYNLLLAVNKSDTGNVKLLLSRGANVNTSTVDGVTPLMYAADNGNLDLVKTLINAGADINKKPFNGATALIVTSKRNHYEIAEYLVGKKADLNIRDIEGVTAVHYAAAFNHFDVMDMLIFYGADKELPDGKGNTPLITAAFNNCLEATDLLIQNGALIDATDVDGNTALMSAVQNNNYEIALLLIDKGADIHKINKGGYSALSYTVAISNYELTEILINAGADVNQKTESGYSVLEIAGNTKDEDIIELLQINDAKYFLNPHFNTISFGPYLDFNFTDYMNGFRISLLDNKYYIGLNSGFGFRPVSNRVLVETSDILTYQYWERRNYFYLGLNKRFDFLRDNRLSTGPYLEVNELLTFGGYVGSDKNPPVKFLTCPSVGWYYSTNIFRTWIGYQHIDYKTPEIKAGRINLGISINVSLIKRGYVNKQINWLE